MTITDYYYKVKLTNEPPLITEKLLRYYSLILSSQNLKGECVFFQTYNSYFLTCHTIKRYYDLRMDWLKSKVHKDHRSLAL